MTRIFYDTEFLENGETIALISIGMVREDGTEYYAVNSDAPWEEIRKNAWLCDNVVVSLPLSSPVQKPILGIGSQYFTVDVRATCVKPRQVIANEVRDFIQATPDVRLWADYGAYDHVALAQLWGPMMWLPEGVPMFTSDLRQEIARYGLTDAELPQQAAGQHNALEDARHNLVMARALDEVAGRG